jgi:F-type H+-transporting ATPase subunit gamma
MDTLEALRDRIDTTHSLGSIVRTMKSLAAVSIHQYEQAAEALADYARTIELGLRVVLSSGPSPIGPDVESGTTGAVVFGSDHGLCGRFNEEVTEFAVERLRTMSDDAGHPILAVGGRAADRLSALGMPPDTVMLLPGAVDGLTKTARDILVTVDRWRGDDGVSRVVVFHNRRSERAVAEPEMAQLVPADLRRFHRLAHTPWPSRRLPTYRIDRGRLLAALVREQLFVTVFRAGAESLASEHASRLASMRAAERNIDERLEEMQSAYRRRRQQSITEELMDVVAGFEVASSGSDGGRRSA